VPKHFVWRIPGVVTQSAKANEARGNCQDVAANALAYANKVSGGAWKPPTTQIPTRTLDPNSPDIRPEDYSSVRNIANQVGQNLEWIGDDLPSAAKFALKEVGTIGSMAAKDAWAALKGYMKELPDKKATLKGLLTNA
jgi:hypothetical protein